MIHVKEVESFVKPILENHQVEAFDDENTLMNLSKNRDLYKNILSVPISDKKSLEKVCTLLFDYLTTDTIPFFKEKLTFEGMYTQIADKKVQELLECGIDATYPASIFKAMVINYKAGHQNMYHAIKEEMQERYQADKAEGDVYYYGDFEEALKELDTKLQEATQTL